VTVGQRRPGSVRVTGEPAELVLFAFGRGAQAELAVTGPPDEVARLRSAVGLPDE
jgi:hypothetical protein